MRASRYLIPADQHEEQVDKGAPPFMDDLVIPISDPCPVTLVSRSIRAAQIVGSTAAEFGFVIHHGEKVKPNGFWFCVVHVQIKPLRC